MRVLLTYPNSFPGIFINKTLKNYFDILNPEINYEEFGETEEIFSRTKPDIIILNIPFAGGIKMNIEKPAELMTKNLNIQNNVILNSYNFKIKNLFFIGSSCMYPKIYEKKLNEKDLFSGPLEDTNLAYATAKICGWQLCKAFTKQYGLKFRTLIPSNLYGEYDDYNEDTAHVIGALLSRFHKAVVNREEEVIIWGSGKPVRDFLYAEDFAKAILFLLKNNYDFDDINIGSGNGYSIKDITLTLSKIIGFNGKITFDISKPDGMKMKVLDTEKINKFGWYPENNLEEGLRKTYKWYIENEAKS